jgi:hypothetical protein
MKLVMWSAACALMLVSTAAAQEAGSGAAKRARETAMRNVKRTLGSLSEGLYVVALGEASLPQAGEGGGGKGEGGARPKNAEGGGGGERGRAAQPQVSWQFQVIEGRDAAATAIVDHMAGATQSNPRDWKLVQRFKSDEREKADAAVNQLQQQPSGEGEGRRKGAGEGQGKPAEK